MRSLSLHARFFRVLLICQSFVGIFADEPDRKREQLLTSAIIFENSFHFFDYVLPAASPGEKLKVVVELQNHAVPFNTLKVTTSCACLNANVPLERVDKDASCFWRFALAVDPKPKALEQFFNATVDAEGGCDHIRLRFKVPLKDVCAFQTKDFVFSVPDDRAVKQFKLPFIISDDVVRSTLKVELTGELSAFEKEIKSDDGGLFVELKSKKDDLFKTEPVGEVIIRRGDQLMCSALCQFNSKAPIEIFPKVAVLNLDSDAKSLESRWILKLRGDDAKNKVAITKITCSAPEYDEVRSSIEFQKVSSDTYVVKGKFSPSASIGSKGEFEWRVTGSHGYESKLLSRFTRAN